MSQNTSALAPIDAALARITGRGPRNIADAHEQNKAYAEAQLAATRKAHPTLAPVSELAGAVAAAFILA